MISPIERAVVVQQDPDNYSVFVSLIGRSGGQGPLLPVHVATHGPRDAVRGNFPELPAIGTHGLVAFTSMDVRNGVWIGSTRSQLTDASAHAPGQGGMAYAAHYGGGWSRRAPDGSTTEAWPDGSVLTVGVAGATPGRHTVNTAQQRVRTPFLPAQRVPVPPGAFPVAFTHPSQASLSLTPSGAWVITAAPGQSVTLAVSGGTSVVIDAAGSVSIVSPGAMNLTATTAVNITAPSVVIGNGGATQAVRLASGANSTILKAQ